MPRPISLVGAAVLALLLWSPIALAQTQVLPPLKARVVEKESGTRWEGEFLQLPELHVLAPIPSSIRTQGGGTSTWTFLIGSTETEALPKSELSQRNKSLWGYMGFLLLSVFGVAMASIDDNSKTWTRRRKARVVGFAVPFGILGLMGLWGWLSEVSHRGTLWVDNATAETYGVFVNGDFRVELSPHSHVELDVVAGRRFVVSKDNRLEEVLLRLESGEGGPVLASLLMSMHEEYLYNIGSANRYRVERRSYR